MLILHNRQYDNILYYNKRHTLWWLLDPYKWQYKSLFFSLDFSFLFNEYEFLFVKIPFYE